MSIAKKTFRSGPFKDFIAQDVYTICAQAYGGAPDVSQTVIGVVCLIRPELKIEIKCIAHL